MSGKTAVPTCRRYVRALVVLGMLAGGAVASTVVAATPASASVVCGSVTVQLAYEGTCGSFGSAAAWYGSYGPGFPTAGGWALAAGDAGQAAAPTSVQGYSIGAPPPGAGTGTDPALGFALSEAQAVDGWSGGSSYSAADEATAAQLLYDEVVWGAAPPVATGGVLAAYSALDGWYEDALGATGSPVLDMNTTAVAQIPTAGAIYQVRLLFPGSGAAASGYDVSISLSGGYGAGGSTTATLVTDSQGYASEEVYADSSSTAVSVTATASVGTTSMDFYDSTSGGEPVVSFAGPTEVTNSDVVGSSSGSGGTGTISIDEGGDDTAYVGLAGGVFHVSNSLGTVVAVLTTDSNGAAGPTASLPLGTYTVHEATAPPGYAPSPDQTVTVVDGGNVIAHFTGAAENHAIPATLTITDTDQQTGAPLAGGTFNVYFDSGNSGKYSQSLGSCTTSNIGKCSPPPDDIGLYLPGNYEVVQVGPPTGYSFIQNGIQFISVKSGVSNIASFSNIMLGALQLIKTGNDTKYYSVSGAQFSLYGPLPSAGLATVICKVAGGRRGDRVFLRALGQADGSLLRC